MFIGEGHINAALFQFAKIFQDVMDISGEAVKMQTDDRVDFAFVYGVHHIHEAWPLVCLAALVIAEYPADIPARFFLCDVLTTKFFLRRQGGAISVFIARDADIDRDRTRDFGRFCIEAHFWWTVTCRSTYRFSQCFCLNS